ncbi:SOS response-associated peptidase family protein [Chitinophaga oryzae]|uniref:Abasic site processing protein n=1 Tax=Chitinophaga oryzae TaxID=2725414 RepID=A0AAE7D9Y0_9BACT|nr:SOS response-associated peptidase family protein [Chitinophaga oryzae]QJB34893.1 SOS response-associated peptidase family protein [Chitinophaga oryzae]QJB41404.1 SOS response-associated peptidase family protein [Chitinophaga oryzae]
MCVDIAFHSDIQITKEAFPGLVIKRTPAYSIEFNEQILGPLFPECSVIVSTDGRQEATTMEWGVFPTWITDRKERDIRRNNQLNLRSEKIFTETASLAHKLRKRRLLIPVNGIYEHRKVNGIKNMVPYFVFYPDGKPFYLPGLYQQASVVDNDGVVTENLSFGLLTTGANTTMAGIHNSGTNKHRMPLFLTEEMAQSWISASLQENEMKEILAYKIPDKDLEYHPVYSIRGGKVRPDGMPKYTLWEWPGLPPLGQDNAQSSLF